MKSYPFRAMVCGSCWLGFNASPLPPNELRDIYDDYLYISPMDGIGHSKYKNILETIKRSCGQGDKIVDIGCADGYLLHQLKQIGYTNLLGVEPSILSGVGRENGLEIIKGYFSPDIFDDGTVDCFILMHVFEHFDNPFLMLEMMKQKLSPKGKILLEVPYFSGEHHQHLFFYNLIFLKRLCSDIGLTISNIEIDDDTKTLRVILDKTDIFIDISILERPVDILDLCLRKNKEYQNKIVQINFLLREKKNIVWWGAGSTSVIYLNQVDQNILKEAKLTVIDGDKNKWGLYIPIINAMVWPFTILKDKQIDKLIVASSFAGEIKETLRLNNISVNNMETFV